jgi:hypothetical protein
MGGTMMAALLFGGALLTSVANAFAKEFGV